MDTEIIIAPNGAEVNEEGEPEAKPVSDFEIGGHRYFNGEPESACENESQVRGYRLASRVDAFTSGKLPEQEYK